MFVPPKASLVRFESRPDGVLVLGTRDTDWREAGIVHLVFQDDEALARAQVLEFQDRHTSNLPNILSLHGLIVLADNRIIATRRSAGLHFHPGKWSISFEEGFDAEDTRVPDPLVGVAQRGMAEEFGIGPEAISAVDPLALVLEAPIANPALLVRVRLTMSSSEFEELAGGGRDRYEWDEMRTFLPDRAAQFNATLLHPTSLLRVRGHGEKPGK